MRSSPHTQVTRKVNEGKFLSLASFTGRGNKASENNLIIKLQNKVPLSPFLLFCVYLLCLDNPNQ